MWQRRAVSRYIMTDKLTVNTKLILIPIQNKMIIIFYDLKSIIYNIYIHKFIII